MNNVISAFIKAKRPPPDHVRNPSLLTLQDKQQNNLILICSIKQNSVTNDALSQLRSTLRPRLAERVPYFEEIAGTNELQIRWEAGTVYQSPSYKQTGSERTDIAMIVKTKSPWGAQKRILIIAGIRGIGTWGAAEFLKKWWRPLYKQKGSDRHHGMSKQGDFAALVRVHYKDLDIKRVDFVNVANLDETSIEG